MLHTELHWGKRSTLFLPEFVGIVIRPHGAGPGNCQGITYNPEAAAGLNSKN